MTMPILRGGKSLSQRIRAYALDVPNAVIAAELGANPRTVAVIRSKQKRPTAYAAQHRKSQRRRRSNRQVENDIAWAVSWANTFPQARAS